VSRCESCGAQIIWAVSKSTGNRMPLDAEPVNQRGLFVIDNGYAIKPRPVHKSHFATCPQAESWRQL
jgi:hypothetical protein